MKPRGGRGTRTPAAGRFLRREGNVRVRRERRQRVAVRALTRVTVVSGIIGLASLAVGASIRWLTTAQVLAVSHIEIQGAEHADVATLRSLAAGAISRNLITLDLAPLAANIRTHPWVRHVVVRKRLPDTLEIRVKEREPCALAMLGGEPYVVDTAGTPVDRFGPRYAGWSFPAFLGLDGLDSAERVVRCRRAARQVRALQRAAPELYEALAEVDLRDPTTTILRFPGVAEPLRVSPTDWLRNLDAFRALHATLRQRHGAIRYVDLRWEGRLAVLPEPHQQP